MAEAILTLPVGHLIKAGNYSLVPGIKALEYKLPGEIFGREHEFIFHSNIGIVQKEFLSYFDGLSGFLKKNSFKLFSFDLGPAAESVAYRPDFHYTAMSRPLDKKRLRQLISSRLAYVRRGFKGKIGFENLNYFAGTAYGPVCDPDFICEVIRDFDAYLVLDLAHALISAQNMRMELYSYLSSLPLERVIEVHLSGPRRLKGKWFDAHRLPSTADLKVLDFVRARLTGSYYLTIEYYKDFSRIQNVYGNLRRRK